MSVVEQLLFAVLGVTILSASLALSDPHFGFGAAKRATPASYVLQSCGQ